MTMEHDYGAEYDSIRRKWTGWFTAPKGKGGGARKVTDERGFILFFDHKHDAAASAGHALCCMLDGKPEAPARGRAFKVTRSGGKARITEEANRIFGGRG